MLQNVYDTGLVMFYIRCSGKVYLKDDTGHEGSECGCFLDETMFENSKETQWLEWSKRGGSGSS